MAYKLQAQKRDGAKIRRIIWTKINNVYWICSYSIWCKSICARIRSTSREPLHNKKNPKQLIWAGFEPATAWIINQFQLTMYWIPVLITMIRGNCVNYTVCIICSNNWNSQLNRNDIDVKELESWLMHSRRNRHALYQFELSDQSQFIDLIWIWSALQYHSNILLRTAANRSW